MKTLTKVKLINWHTFSNEEFEKVCQLISFTFVNVLP